MFPLSVVDLLLCHEETCQGGLSKIVMWQALHKLLVGWSAVVKICVSCNKQHIPCLVGYQMNVEFVPMEFFKQALLNKTVPFLQSPKAGVCYLTHTGYIMMIVFSLKVSNNFSRSLPYTLYSNYFESFYLLHGKFPSEECKVNRFLLWIYALSLFWINYLVTVFTVVG